jgi:hypothetical protein
MKCEDERLFGNIGREAEGFTPPRRGNVLGACPIPYTPGQATVYIHL